MTNLPPADDELLTAAQAVKETHRLLRWQTAHLRALLRRCNEPPLEETLGGNTQHGLKAVGQLPRRPADAGEDL